MLDPFTLQWQLNNFKQCDILMDSLFFNQAPPWEYAGWRYAIFSRFLYFGRDFFQHLVSIPLDSFFWFLANYLQLKDGIARTSYLEQMIECAQVLDIVACAPLVELLEQQYTELEFLVPLPNLRKELQV